MKKIEKLSKATIAFARDVFGDDFVPLHRPVFEGNERQNLIDCIDSNFVSSVGARVQEFEEQIADFTGSKHAIAMVNGTAALHLAIKLAGVKTGDEVISQALTFIATCNAISYAGAKPLFIDVDIDTMGLSPSALKIFLEENAEKSEAGTYNKVSGRRISACVPMHTFGFPCRIAEIAEICTNWGIALIEDSADTLGGTINGKSSGYYSDMSITSFYGSHIINCAGNGGALAINDDKVMEKAKLLRSWGRSSSLFDERSESIENRFNVRLDGVEYDAKFVFETVGYNLEGNELGASFGLVQLQKLEQNIKTRQGNFERQCQFFNKHAQFFSNPEMSSEFDTAWLAFPILIKKDAPFSRKEFQIYLEERNIQTRVVFTGNVLRQPMTKNIEKRVIDNGYPNADAVMERGVLLPLHHGLSDEMFERFHKTIDEFVYQYS